MEDSNEKSENVYRARDGGVDGKKIWERKQKINGKFKGKKFHGGQKRKRDY
jgi:hypothetical protein